MGSMRSDRQRLSGWRIVALAAAGTMAVGSGIIVVEGGLGPAVLVVRSVTGGVFIAAGAVTWVRAGSGRLGTLFLLAGVAMCLINVGLWPGPVATTVRVLTGGYAPFGALLGHLLLAYPSGRLATRLERVAVSLLYAVTGLYMLGQFAVGDSTGQRYCAPVDCSGIAPVWVRSDVAERALSWGLFLTYPWVLALVVVALARRWLRSAPTARRTLRPAMVSMAGACGLGLTSVVIRGFRLDGDGTVRVILAAVWGVGVAGVAVGLLLGVLRSQMAVYGLGELVSGMGGTSSSAQVQAVLRRLLRDPSAQLLSADADEWVYWDVDGQSVHPAPGRTWLLIGDPPGGAVVYDAAATPDADLLHAVVSALHLLLDNARLRHRLEQQLLEVRASRARIVAAGDDERRRVERDLHDGAQQHLIGSALTVRLARQSVRTAPQQAEELLLRAEDQLRTALHEIRDLARGLHPAILTDAGVGAAVESLSQRLPLQVLVSGGLTDRYPAVAETAAYFVVCEALVNAVKHAQVSEAHVTLSPTPAGLVVEVVDHGLGGADAGSGSGLRGLSDRLDAVGGVLTVETTRGVGTAVRAVIPSQPLSPEIGDGPDASWPPEA